MKMMEEFMMLSYQITNQYFITEPLIYIDTQGARGY